MYNITHIIITIRINILLYTYTDIYKLYIGKHIQYAHAHYSEEGGSDLDTA